MHPRAIHGRKFALLVRLTTGGDFDESCCLIGRAVWNGRQVGVDTADGERFLIPNDRLSEVKAVLQEDGGEFEGAEFYVVLDDLTEPRANRRQLRPAC
jgi:hypothetical protein